MIFVVVDEERRFLESEVDAGRLKRDVVVMRRPIRRAVDSGSLEQVLAVHEPDMIVILSAV